MKKLCMLLAVVCGVSVWAGNTCTWKSDELTTSTDWTAAGNYVEGVAPQKGNGDRVVIPANKAVFLKASDAKSSEVVSDFGLVSIRMLGRRTDSGVKTTGTLIVEVGADDPDVSISCPVYGSRYDTQDGYDGNSGQVIKRGTGALYLCSTNSTAANASNPGRYDYDTTLVVEAGDLYLPQGIVPANLTYYALAISNNATLHLADLPEARPTHYVGLLFGEENALVTNSHENAHADCQLHVSGGEYAGVLANLRFLSREGNSRATRLTGSRSTMTSNVTADWNRGAGPSESDSSTLCFTTIGRSGEPSSVGVGDALVFGQVGGAFVYEGADETTDKALYFQYPGNSILFFDAGPNGGLVFDSDSKWNIGYTQAANFRMASLVLQGDNARPCEIAAEIDTKVNGTVTNRVFITKRGSGTWRFRDNAKRNGIGGLAVERGTLQFDTIAERGVMCALGTAVDCHTNYWGAYNADAKVDYAFLLGSEYAQGILEYTGNADATCSTRPIALTGKGGRLLNSTGSALRFGGVAPAPGSSGIMTFSLGGNGTGGNVLRGLTDTESAPISVVKEDGGEWALEKECSFRGKVTAAGGRLIARSDRNAKFTWFRLVIRDVVSNAGATETSAALLMKIFLYNANGVRQNVDLAYGSDPLTLLPGQAVADYVNASGAKVADPSLLFTDAVDNNGWKLWPILDPSDETGTKCLKVTMRLAANADEIVAYDLASRYPLTDTANCGSNVKSYVLQGSADGKDWQELDSISDTTDEQSPMQIRPYNKRYYSDGTGLNATTIVEPRIKDGIPIGPAIVTRKVGGGGALDDISGVELTGGEIVQEGEATELDTLTVDAVAGGTLDNFTFAEEGTLDVLNLPKGGSVELPLEFANVPAEEIAKLANWSLTIGGEVKSSKSIAIRNGKVCIDSSGLMLIFR